MSKPEPDEPLQEKAPAPPMDPRYGDKTPAYVVWFWENHPREEFARRYGGRRVGGFLLPPNPTELPRIEMTMAPVGDIPKSSMETEAPEVWFRK